MGVANLTEFANSVTVSNILNRLMSPALVKSTTMMALMAVEDLPMGTQTKLWQKAGSLTAKTLAESTANAVDADGELTDTSVSSTVAKAVVVSGLTVEAERFSNISIQRLADEQGSSIGRFVDDDALSLFSGLTNNQTAATTLTLADIQTGQFNIYNSECPNKEETLAIVLHHKGANEIRAEILASTASAFVNENWLSVLQGVPQPNNFVGTIPGLGDVYQTSGHATSGGDNVQAIFHPRWAFGASMDTSPTTWIERKGSEGFYTEVASYFFFDTLEWNDTCASGLLSDS